VVTITFSLFAPDAPTINSVTAGNVGELTVTWNVVSGAYFYDVYYNYADNTGTAVKVSNVTSPFKITGIAGNTTYYVWVIARNLSVESGFSGNVTGTTDSFPQSQTISIDLFPSAQVILPQSVTVSKTSSITLSATGDFTSYQWYLDGEAAGTTTNYYFLGVGKTQGAVADGILP